MQPADAYHNKEFDPKKLVCQLDQKLKRIQMIGAVADLELTGPSKHRRAKAEDSKTRASYNKGKDSLLPLDTKDSAKGWR